MYKDLLPTDDLTIEYHNLDFVTGQPEWPHIVARTKALCTYLLNLTTKIFQHRALQANFKVGQLEEDQTYEDSEDSSVHLVTTSQLENV